MLEFYGTLIYFLIRFKDFQLISVIHVRALLFQKLTMITFPEKQVCYMARLSGNLPRPLQLLLAIKKVKIKLKKCWKVFIDGKRDKHKVKKCWTGAN